MHPILDCFMSSRMLLAVLGCCCFYLAQPQVKEDFQDGNFLVNPAWLGNITDWTVNQAGQLESASETVNNSFYLSTPNSLCVETEWEFFIRLNFNPSGVNYADIFLTASASDLLQKTTTGYFVRIGNTLDEVSLYRKDATGIAKLIDGEDGTVSANDNLLRIKVIRNSSAQFTLFRDIGSTGYYTKEGSVTDLTYMTSSYFGILVRQSTSSFFKKHFFDDILIKQLVPDLSPPEVVSALAISSNQLDVLFSETVDPVSGVTLDHYMVSNDMSNPVSAKMDALNSALVHLTFNKSFHHAQIYLLHVEGVKDLSENALHKGQISFSYFFTRRFDVLIHEIMADPSPPGGLPEAEFIELRNNSGRQLQLSGWKLITPTSAAVLPDCLLQPDSFVILTAPANEHLFTTFGNVRGVAGFPPLDNEGTVVSILSKEGMVVHSVSYSKAWYVNTVKSEGGWTLEMIDTQSPCTGKNNWKASTDPRGGTPGTRNSVEGVNKDDTPPKMIRTFCTDSLTIHVFFDEPLDSLSASAVNNYYLENYTGTFTVIPLAPLFNEVKLHLSVPLLKKTIYQLTATSITDCQGNVIGNFNKARTGCTEEANRDDVVINEILFHPTPDGTDYVECLNLSNKMLDAAHLFLANRNGTGAVSSIKKISALPFTIFPGDYLVLTEDVSSLQKSYLVKHPELVLVVPSMPSFPNDKGNVILANSQGGIIDEIPYSEKWHFALISNNEGVALERIDPVGSSTDNNNWHSASSSSGYGTPTYINSQNKEKGALNAVIEVRPTIFSPDNDGHDDMFLVNYQAEAPGYVANIRIFNSYGMQVRYLVKNALLGRSGQWTWDGLDENNRSLPVGFYVVYIEFFNLHGKKKLMKRTVVLAK